MEKMGADVGKNATLDRFRRRASTFTFNLTHSRWDEGEARGIIDIVEISMA